jgi:hypothetical protein
MLERRARSREAVSGRAPHTMKEDLKRAATRGTTGGSVRTVVAVGGVLVVAIGLYWYATARHQALEPARSGDAGGARADGASESGSGAADEGAARDAASPTDGNLLADARENVAALAHDWTRRLAPFADEHASAIQAALLDLSNDTLPRLDVDAVLLADLAVFLRGDRVPLEALAAHTLANERDVALHALMLASFALHGHGDAAIDAALLANVTTRLDALAQSRSAEDRAAERRVLAIARATGEVFAARGTVAPTVELLTHLALLTTKSNWREHDDALRGATRHVFAHHPGGFDREQVIALSEAVSSLRLETERMAWHTLMVRTRDEHTLGMLRDGAGSGLGIVGHGLRRPTSAELDVLLAALAADKAPPAEPLPDERTIAVPTLVPRDTTPDPNARIAERLRDRVRALEGLVHLGPGVASYIATPSLDPERTTLDQFAEALANYGAAEGFGGVCELAPYFSNADGLEPDVEAALLRSFAWYVFDPRRRAERDANLVLLDELGLDGVVPQAWRNAP